MLCDAIMDDPSSDGTKSQVLTIAAALTVAIRTVGTYHGCMQYGCMQCGDADCGYADYGYTLTTALLTRYWPKCSSCSEAPRSCST